LKNKESSRNSSANPDLSYCIILLYSEQSHNQNLKQFFIQVFPQCESKTI